jgi:hypothetical protein
MPETPVLSTAPNLSAQSNDGTDAEAQEQPTLLYPGFPVVSLSDYWREIPDRWRIWYARAGDDR